MATFTTALIPVLTLILLGYALKRMRFMPEVAWAGMEKLTYYILFPALLIGSIGPQHIERSPWLEILIVCTVTLAVISLALLLFRTIRRTGSGAVFTSVFQGGVRFNTYIALSVALALYGEDGLATASLAAGFMIVLINVACISVFAVWGRTQITGVSGFLREVLFNPLIAGCAVGWFLSLTGIGLPGVSLDMMEILGRAALPFGLLAVGAALKPKSVRGHSLAILISSLAQFLVKPLTVFILLQWINLPATTEAVLIVIFMVPTASSSYILARQLGGDTDTMASIITVQTLLAFAAMPILATFLL